MAQQLLIPGFVKNPREIAAAGLGGIAGTVFDVVTLTVLVKLSVASAPVSAFLAAGVGAVVCFVWNKFIAFRDGTAVTLEQVVRFGIVAVTTGLLTAGAVKLLYVDHGVPLLLSKAIAAAAIFAVWTFPAQKYFVFKRPAPAV